MLQHECILLTVTTEIIEEQVRRPVVNQHHGAHISEVIKMVIQNQSQWCNKFVFFKNREKPIGDLLHFQILQVLR